MHLSRKVAILKPKVYLGIDIGTSVTKGTAILSDGEILAHEYSPSKYGSSSDEGHEHDPDLIWWDQFLNVATKILDNIGSRRNEVECIAVTGMIPNIVPVDKSGKPLHNGLLFYDNRAYDIEVSLDKELNSPRWQNEVLSKLIWLRENKPNVWTSTYKVLTTHSYIVLKLTGEYTVDIVTAIESGNVFSPTERSWNESLLSRFGIDTNVFPEIHAPKEIIGYLQPEAAKQLGIRPGIPVVAGTGDTISSILGAGLRLKDEMLIYYGTYNCSALLLFNIEDVLSGNITANPLAWTATIPRSGQQLNSLARQFFPSNSSHESLSMLDRKAAESTPGANGVVFIQTFNLPESTVSTEPTGGLVNISIENTTADFSRAILEAFGYGLRYSFEVLNPPPPTPKQCYAAGGGARSPIWKQIISDITGFEQLYMAAADRGVGSAILAGAAHDPDFLQRASAHLLNNSVYITPCTDNSEIYEARYQTYCSFLA